MQKLQNTIQKYGPACLVVSRFVEGMKQFMPLACGIAKMSRKEFLLGNALATTIWVAVFSLLTNFTFEHLSVLSQFYTDHRYVVWSSAALLFSLMIFALLKRKKRKSVNALNQCNSAKAHGINKICYVSLFIGLLD